MDETEYYLLDGDLKPVRVSHTEWSNLTPEDRLVAETRLPDGVVVTTRFVGSAFDRKGERMETMFTSYVWSNEDEWDEEHFPTWDDAVAGHAEIVARLQTE